jgi:hypothetical protein
MARLRFPSSLAAVSESARARAVSAFRLRACARSDDARFAFDFDNFTRQLSELHPRLSKLVAVPSPSPQNYLGRADRLGPLCDAERGPRRAGRLRLGVHGMGGIGKSLTVLTRVLLRVRQRCMPLIDRGGRGRPCLPSP